MTCDDSIGRPPLLPIPESEAWATICAKQPQCTSPALEALEYLVPVVAEKGVVMSEFVVDVWYQYPGRYAAQGSCAQAAKAALEAINVQRSLIEDKVGYAALIFSKDNNAKPTLMRINECRRYPIQNIDLNACSTLIVCIVQEDLDEDPVQIMALCSKRQLASALDAMLDLVVAWRKTTESRLLLMAQRAIIVCADLLWRISIPHDRLDSIVQALSTTPALQHQIREAIQHASERDRDYHCFLDPFLRAGNALELRDFEKCANALHAKAEGPPLEWSPSTQRIDENTVGVRTSSGMRVGISSANASDNWTNAKLRGGSVVNVCVNLNHEEPVRASCCRLKSNSSVLILQSTDWLDEFKQTRKLEFDWSMSDTKLKTLLEYHDNTDVFRLLKYALVFVGILDQSRMDEYYHRPSLALERISAFACHETLLVSTYNNGPSRSGFASSSAVSTNLLRVLYKASGQDHIADHDCMLGSMVLLFENRMGLKSGRQDVDGLRPGGLKSITYHPTPSFVTPSISCLDSFDMKTLHEHLLLVDSGIQRSANLDNKRGLNMRHWAFLSRQTTKFVALRQSYGLHRTLVSAFSHGDLERLGACFLEYMSLRETIDPGATTSKFDSVFGTRVLRLLFDPLVEQGFIHGGMLTGAMGGGVAMLVLTSKGREVRGGQRAIDTALEELKHLENKGIQPFEHMRVFDYTVNKKGVVYQE